MADQLIEPVDVEQAVIDELSPFFTIGTAIPTDPPPLFLRVVAVGGYNRDLVTDQPLVTLEAFALLESTAGHALATATARLELAAKRGKLGSETCYGLQTSSLPQNYPMPSLPTHKRYITTIAPVLRRRVNTL